MRGVGLLLLASVCASGQDGPEHVLARLRGIVLEQAGRIPNYTCVETIEREFRRGQRGNSDAPVRSSAGMRGGSCRVVEAMRADPFFQMFSIMLDRFRVEVRTGRRVEMYAWPGAARFADSPLSNLVIPGPSSTGVFSTVLVNLFSGDLPEFVFDGEKTVNGRRAYAWSFRVPVERSHHVFKVGSKEGIPVAYEGFLFADVETGAPLRVTTSAVALPSKSGCCGFTTALDYAPLRIGDGEFLLPNAARLHYTLMDGTEVDSAFAFSGCHEYGARSTVVFGNATPSAPAVVERRAEPLRIPSGLPVAIALTSEIDSDTAAAGDRFTGRVDGAVVDKQKNVLVPDGAVVHGRVKMVRRMIPVQLAMIALAIETVEVAGREVEFRLRPAYPIAAPPMPGPAEGNLLIRHAGTRAVLESGLRTEWFTRGQK